MMWEAWLEDESVHGRSSWFTPIDRFGSDLFSLLGVGGSSVEEEEDSGRKMMAHEEEGLVPMQVSSLLYGNLPLNRCENWGTVFAPSLM